uniref:Uncharacterized protein n=1 Tax=Triticum urartu TaxID=4572 RepID=A0A8R7P6M8_TRIUA
MGDCCSREIHRQAVATVRGAKSLGHPNPHAKQK